MATWICAKCDSAVPDDRSICRSCGAPRPSASVPRNPDAPPPPVEQIPEEPPPVEVVSEDEVPFEEVPDEPDEPDEPETDAPKGEPWTCARCRKLIEPDFDVCWSCGTTRQGAVDPSFRRVEVAPTASPGSVPVADDLGPDPEDPSKPPGEPPARTCPSCGEELVPIQLVDSSGDYGSRQRELRYAAGDAKRGWLFGYPTEGVIRAQLCPRCGRVGLYAVPNP